MKVLERKNGLVFGLVAGLLVLAGCGGSTEEVSTDPDASPTDTADGQGGGDTEPDATEPDADATEPDIAAPDVDVTPDAEPDADAGAQDVGPDIDAQPPDADVPDTIEDVVPDVDTTLPDGVDDTTLDVADVTPDIVEDVVPDTVEDVVPDVGEDTFDAAADTTDDAEVEVNLCATVRCAASTNPCATIVCEPSTGNCVPTPIDDGLSCSDATACRGEGVCSSGECVDGEAVAEGSSCTPDSESACSLEPTCVDGLCAGGGFGCMADGIVTGELFDGTTGTVWESGSTAAELRCRPGFLMTSIQPLYSAEFVIGWEGVCTFPTVSGSDSRPFFDVSLSLPESAGGGFPDPESGGFDVECPSGHAVVGFTWLPSLTSGSPQRVKAVCAEFLLVDERPEGFSIEVGEAVEPVYDATVAGAVQTVRCDADEVVQAVTLDASNRIRVACARPVPVLARSGPSTPTLRGPETSVQMCPYGSGLVGFVGELAINFYSGHTTRAAALCRVFELVPNGDGGGTTTWGDLQPASLSPLGALSGDGELLGVCPENTWVYAASIYGSDLGSGGPLLTGATLQCAPVLMAPSLVTELSFRLVADPTDTTVVVYGESSDAILLLNECPEGQSVVGLWAYSGEVWDNAALMCSPRYP